MSIPFEQKELECAFTVPADLSAECTAVVLTHGAGGDMHARQLESLAHALARSGVLCLRFTCRAVNFMYRFRAHLTVVVRTYFSILYAHEMFILQPHFIIILFLITKENDTNVLLHK